MRLAKGSLREAVKLPCSIAASPSSRSRSFLMEKRAKLEGRIRDFESASR